MIARLLAALKAAFAWLAGRQAGEADAQAAQSEATINADHRIAAAESAAPADAGAVVGSLRDGTF